MNRTAVEFFAGIGLVRLALQKAGWSVVFANDVDSKKYEMYSAAFGGKEYIVRDIASLHEAQIELKDDVDGVGNTFIVTFPSYGEVAGGTLQVGNAAASHV